MSERAATNGLVDVGVGVGQDDEEGVPFELHHESLAEDFSKKLTFARASDSRSKYIAVDW